MWVVKLGGSLCNSSYLVEWLDQLAACDEAIVIVPGGGPFADQVRLAQQHWAFDDRQAHAMALLAMDQMGHMLCGLNPLCVPAADHATLSGALAADKTPVWLASRLVLQERTIAADWQVTSDSLSLWLARQLRADGLLLVKSGTLPCGSVDIPTLQAGGIVDDAFAMYADRATFPVHLLNRANLGDLPSVFADEATTGVRLAV